MIIARIAMWLSFALLVGFLAVLISPLGRLLHIPGDLSTYLVPIGLLGLLVATLAVVGRTSRWSRIFLITAGASAVGWPVSMLLNRVLSNFFPGEGVTYVLVFYIIPVVFLIGAAGGTAIGLKQLVWRRKR